MSNAKTLVDTMIVPHTAFLEVQHQLEMCFAYAAGKQAAEGLALLGDSGSGKTTAIEEFAAAYPSRRDKSGMEVPILRATVPSGPTVKSLAGVLLAALEDPDCEKGTENEKSFRLRELMKGTGTRMVMIDEFQHFYDQGKRQIMYRVADWLKVLIDDTRTTLVVAGLPSCQLVIDQNEQLARRFLAPITLPRFSWTDPQQRGEFVSILASFNDVIRTEYDIPQMDTEDMAFRFYCATGGLIGLLTKLLRQALRTAASQNAVRISLEDLHLAHSRTISQRPVEPFIRGFQTVLIKETLDRVSAINRRIESQETHPARRPRSGSKRYESAHSMLVTS